MSDDPHGFQAMFTAALAGLTEGDVSPFVAMFAPDGSMEFPYRVGAAPSRVTGTADLAAYFAGFTAVLRIDRVFDVRFHFTVDPAVVIVEFSCEGTAVQTGLPYHQRYISVVTIEDGLVVDYRDYWNPVVGIVAMGRGEIVLRDA